jgi:hypothetical protein
VQYIFRTSAFSGSINWVKSKFSFSCCSSQRTRQVSNTPEAFQPAAEEYEYDGAGKFPCDSSSRNEERNE